MTRVEAVEVALADALGRVTAAPVWALRSSPAYDASAMDGIAVRASDTVGATETSPRTLARYTVVDTGDALPDGCDAVVMREHVHWADGVPEVRAAAAPWQHVRTIGEDVSATELLLPEGHRLRPVDVAAAGAAGHVALAVRRAPHVVIIPTGDEVRPLGHDPAPGELVDTNSLMLAAQAREVGCTVESLPVLPDDSARIGAAVADAAGRADLVIVIAGSSAGRDDYTAEVIGRVGTLLVHGVAVRPGHPVVLGRVGTTAVLGAPGYPVSAALTFEIFALPLLAALEGAAPVERPRARARLARRLASSLGADDWIRVRLGRVAGGLVATPLPRGAGVLTSLVRADGLLVVPAALEGHDAGTEVEVRLLRDLDAVERTIVAIGSHDPVLDLAASLLRARNPLQTLVSGAVGSLSGLVALRDGLCHFSGCHLLDPESGRYTLPWIERVMPGQAVEVIRLVHREQGLIVARRQPARHRRTGRPAAPALRQSPAGRGHPCPARPRARQGRHRPGDGLRLRARGADASRGRRRRRRRPRGCRPGSHGRGPRLRTGLRPRRTRAVRPRRCARANPRSRHCSRSCRTSSSAQQVEAMGGYSTTETGRQIL